MATQSRSLAVVTGASTGIGYELAKLCAKNGFDLWWRRRTKINEAAREFEALGAKTSAVETDLATLRGRRQTLRGDRRRRPVDALLANAGRGLGSGFLDQDFDDVRHVIDTNITGTLYLLQKVGRDMVRARRGAS